MPRGARILPDNGMFHLIARGNNGVKVFRHRYDFLQFKKILLRFVPQANFSIQHYAFMNTHFHLLAWLEDTKILATAMKAILVSYQHYYRRRYGYKGHLWHSRFRSIIMTSDEQWLQCARYIELNPVYADICRNPKDYYWTSYHYHAMGKLDPLINIAKFFSGETEWKKGVENVAYREFVTAGIDLDYQYLKKQFERENFGRKQLEFQKSKKVIYNL